MRVSVPVVDSPHCIEHPERKADVFHHIIPHVLGGTKTVPLCDECHEKIHGNKNRNKLSTSYLIRRGLDKAILRGKKLGRPRLRNDTEIKRLYLEGESKSQIARTLKIGRATVQDSLREVK